MNDIKKLIVGNDNTATFNRYTYYEANARINGALPLGLGEYLLYGNFTQINNTKANYLFATGVGLNSPAPILKMRRDEKGKIIALFACPVAFKVKSKDGEKREVVTQFASYDCVFSRFIPCEPAIRARRGSILDFAILPDGSIFLVGTVRETIVGQWAITTTSYCRLSHCFEPIHMGLEVNGDIRAVETINDKIYLAGNFTARDTLGRIRGGVVAIDTDGHLLEEPSFCWNIKHPAGLAVTDNLIAVLTGLGEVYLCDNTGKPQLELAPRKASFITIA